MAGPVGAASAESRRFWIVVLVFALLNVAAWVVYDRLQTPARRDLLAVVEALPGPDADGVMPAALAWVFNMDVVSSEKLGEVQGEAPGAIVPAVPGRWVWAKANELVFEPAAAWPKGTKFAATLYKDRLKTPDGFVMAGPHATTFSTPALDVEGVRQAAFNEDDRAVIEITFTDKVLPADVKKHVTVKGPDGKAILWEPFGGNTGEVFRMQTGSIGALREREETRFVNVEVGAGLAGVSGPLGLAEAQTYRVELSGVLMATEASAFWNYEGEPIIRVRFNNRVEWEKVRGLISVEPAVDFRVGSTWDGVELTGGFAAGTRYAVKIGKPKGAEGEVVDEKNVPREGTLSVFMPDRSPSARFEKVGGYLGSGGNRTVLVKAVNTPAVWVSATRLYDSNLVAWCNSQSVYEAGGLGKALVRKRFVLANQKNKTQELRISLDELLGEKAAADGVYQLQVSTDLSGAEEGEQTLVYGRWGSDDTAVLTLSDLALSAKQTHDGVTVWVVSLSNGKPVEGARVRAYTNKNQLLAEGKSGADGLVRLEKLSPAKGESLTTLVADAGEATRGLTWLSLGAGQWDLSDVATGGRAYLRKGQEAYVYTDRGVYRPGETVVLRAIVRGAGGAVPAESPVEWTVRRPDGRAWKTLGATLDKDGAAEWRVTMPDDVVTGEWSATVGLPGKGASFGGARYLVEEFMPERLKMSLKLADGTDARVALGNAPLPAAVQTDYLFGQAAAGLNTRLKVWASPGQFSAKGWEGFAFGDDAQVVDLLGGVRATGQDVEVSPAVLDAEGKHVFLMNLGVLRADGEATKRLTTRGAWQVSVSATVSEHGGRSVSAWRQISVDTAPYFVGLKDAKGKAIIAGQPHEYAVAVVKGDGKVSDAAGLEAVLYRERWNNSLQWERGRYVYQSSRVLDVVKDGAKLEMTGGEGTCAVTPGDPGAYVLVVRDVETGQFASVRMYATREGGWEETVSLEKPERLEVKVEGNELKSFTVGDEAMVTVRSPFAGQLLLTVETDDVLATQVVEMTEGTVRVPVRIPAGAEPNAYISATVVRAVDAAAAWRTHRAYGMTPIEVERRSQALQVEVQAPESMRPGRTLDVKVRVHNSEGDPVRGAAVALAAVDEGVLRVTAFQAPDPFSFFTAKRALGVGSRDIYGMLMPEVIRPDGVSVVGGGDGKFYGMAAGRLRSSPVSAKRVKPVSLVPAIMHTDEEGWATVHVDVPQFVGNLRLTAVTYSGDAYATGGRDVKVASPVMVQSSWPRFAAPGDVFLAPVTVFNNTKDAGKPTVTVTLSGDGEQLPLEFKGSPEKKITLAMEDIAAGGQGVFPLTLRAADRVGVVKVRVEAALNGETSFEEFELPVRPASSKVTESGYLVATAGEELALKMPAELMAGTAGVEIRVTPRPEFKLPAGLAYLDRYPYGCMEQTVSGLFPLVYLQDVGDRIAPDLFDRKRLDHKVQVGLTRLVGMQTSDGGLAMWQGDSGSWAWGSVYAAHFLVEAKAAGQEVPEDLYNGLMRYARGVLDSPLDGDDTVELHAYAAYVLARTGKPERAAMNRLAEVIAQRTKDERAGPGEHQGRFLLAAAQLAAGRRDLAKGLLPETLPAVREGRQLDANLGSGVRDRALMLSTLLAVDPGHAEIPALAEKIAAAAGPHGWASTQETSFAVMALGRYLRTIKDDAVFDRVEVAAGGKVIGEALESKSLILKRDEPLRDVRVKVSGKAGAKAYVAWRATGVPLAVQGDAANGIKVQRTYLDSKGKEVTSAVTGDLLTVELVIEAPVGLANVVVDDLLPAGLEIENPRLVRGNVHPPVAATTQPMAVLYATRTEVRDDRMVVMADVPGGRSRYVYAARAVNEGMFVVPAARAECMYDETVNGTGGGGGTLTITRPEVPAHPIARGEAGR